MNENYACIIKKMKHDDFSDAKAVSIDIYDNHKKIIGRLVPIGNWVIKDSLIIEEICAWRMQAMRFFLTQFESTFDRTKA